MPASLVKSFATQTGKTVKAVEKLWAKAKELATEAGRKEDYAYIVGILKRMLKIESGGEQSPPGSSFLAEVFGEDAAERILNEQMPASVKASVTMRWLEIEKQLRNVEQGQVSWPTLARSLRMAIYSLLNWAAKDRPQERFSKFIGII